MSRASFDSGWAAWCASLGATAAHRELRRTPTDYLCYISVCFFLAGWLAGEDLHCECMCGSFDLTLILVKKGGASERVLRVSYKDNCKLLKDFQSYFVTNSC